MSNIGPGSLTMGNTGPDSLTRQLGDTGPGL